MEVSTQRCTDQPMVYVQLALVTVYFSHVCSSPNHLSPFLYLLLVPPVGPKDVSEGFPH